VSIVRSNRLFAREIYEATSRTWEDAEKQT
jgi:hypothetical protein